MEGLRCVSCTFINLSEAIFCQRCGASLVAPGADESNHDEELPKRSNRKPLPSERKPVTILFADIVGSSSIAEKLDPEEWKEIVSGAHRIVGQAVRRFDGTVAQFLGDGVLAFFGAPVTHEDDPQRAVRTAWEIQKALKEYRDELAGIVEDFQMRIGMHSGTVVVGQVGDGEFTEYLAVGDAVNLAARLQSAARPGGILVSEAIEYWARTSFELADKGEIDVKGFMEAVHVFEVVGPTVNMASGRGIPGLESPLVGRDTELQILLDALERLGRGSGGIIFTLGEAGIGKSRIVEEARCVSTVDTHWLEGRSLSYGGALAFWPFQQLILDDLGLSDGDPPLRRRLGLRHRLEALVPEKTEYLTPYLTYLLGVEEVGRGVAQLGGEAFKYQLIQSIVTYFAALADRQPLVLVLEDFHWADPSTLETAEKLLALTNRTAILLLFIARIDQDHGSWRLKFEAETRYSHRCSVIQLSPLGNSELIAMIHHLLDDSKLPQEFQQMILERTDGNPLYLEELLHSLIDQGVMTWERDQWWLAQTMETIEIPRTLQRVLLARIDRLEDDVRQTLQLASVIGRSFLYRILEAIAEVEQQLVLHLDELQRVDLVREKSRKPELEYIFKHSLIQEAAYHSLLRERRADFHRRVAVALESLFADRKPEFYGLLAHHFDLAGEIHKALEYYQLAGDKARLEYTLEEATQYYERLVELQAEMGNPEAEASTWLKLGLVYQADFEFERAHLAYENAFQLQRHIRPRRFADALDDSSRTERRIFRVGGFWDGQLVLDPGMLAMTYEGEIIFSLFSGLVEFDLEANVVPHIARSWEVLDEGLRYVFHLREDAFWTDGKQIKAADFEWAWKRNLAPGNPDYPAQLLDVIQGAHAYRMGENPNPDNVAVKALDDWTLEVHLETTVAYFISLMAQPVAYPLPRKAIEGYGVDWWKPPYGVYSGAFQMVEFSDIGGKAERNPSYFGSIPGNLDGFEWEQIVRWDSNVLRRLLEGKLDFGNGALQAELIDSLPRAYLQTRKGLATLALVINPMLPPMDDVRVRKALACGVDFGRLAERMLHSSASNFGGGLIPPGMMGHSPDLGLGFNLQLARDYLTEAGYPGGKGLPAINYGTFSGDPGAMDLKMQLRENLGIELHHVTIPMSHSIEDPLDMHLTVQGWSADYPDPDIFMRLSSFVIFLKNVGWANEQYDQMVEEAARSSDRTRRMTLYREADRILVNHEALVVPIEHNHRRAMDLIQPTHSQIVFDVLGNLNYKYLKLDD